MSRPDDVGGVFGESGALALRPQPIRWTTDVADELSSKERAALVRDRARNVSWRLAIHQHVTPHRWPVALRMVPEDSKGEVMEYLEGIDRRIADHHEIMQRHVPDDVAPNRQQRSIAGLGIR